MPTLLKNLKLKKLSFVDKGANPGADVILLKRADIEKDAPTKTENGKHFRAGDYAHVPDKTKPSTWKLRLTNTPGGAPDPHIVGAAVAALGAGFRGNKASIPSKDRAKVKNKVRAAWHKANPDKNQEDLPPVLRKADYLEEPMNELLEKVLKITKSIWTAKTETELKKAEDDAKQLPQEADGMKATDEEKEEMSEEEKAKKEKEEKEACATAKAKSLELLADIAHKRAEMRKSKKRGVNKDTPDPLDTRIQTFRAQLPAELQEAFDDLDDDEQVALVIDAYADEEGEGGESAGAAAPAEGENKEAAEAQKALKRRVAKMATEAAIRASVIKKQNVVLTSKVEKMEQEREVERIAKTELADVPGAPELAEAVYKLRKSDKAAADLMVQKLKAQAEQIKESRMFEILGGGSQELMKAEDALVAKAKEIQKAENISYAKAYDKALQLNKDLYAQAETERLQRIKAAGA